MSANAFSSSPFGRPNRWPTPTAEQFNYGEDPATWLERAERLRQKHNNQNGAGMPLGIAAKLASDQWPTPTARDHRSVHATPETHAKRARPLSETVGLWATPKATIAGPDFAKTDRSATGLALQAQASLWATPTVADTEGGRLNRSGARQDELLLRGQAKALHSRQDQGTSPPGETSSPYALTLNPLFVEWLMGWPQGFTALVLGPTLRAPFAWTGCAYSEMALCRWKRLTRSALWRLPLPPGLPAQLDLFG
jgi:hypothetical protein